mgnify:CR=1 FL=1
MIFRKFLSQRTVMPYSGDAAEAGHDAVVQLVAQLRNIGDRRGTALRSPCGSTPESSAGSGSIFRPSMADDGVAFVQQIVRERDAGGPEAGHQHLASARPAWRRDCAG